MSCPVRVVKIKPRRDHTVINMFLQGLSWSSDKGEKVRRSMTETPGIVMELDDPLNIILLNNLFMEEHALF